MAKSFLDLEKKVLALFDDGEYQQVLNELAANEANFPDEIGFNYYLRICAAARLDDAAQACDLLEAAFEQGLWFTEDILRESPSLKPLNTHKRFEKLIAVSLDKMANARMENVVKTAVPDQQAPYPLLLALHGNGSHVEAEFGHWQTAVSAGYLVVAPQSSFAMLPGRFYWNGIETALPEIKNHLAEIEKQHDIDFENVIVGGFSMGGDISLAIALSGAVPVKRFLLVGPGGHHFEEPEKLLPPLLEQAQAIKQAKGRDLKGLILMSEDDPHINKANIRKVAQMLNEANIPCEIAVYNGLLHEYPPDFKEKLHLLMDKQPV